MRNLCRTGRHGWTTARDAELCCNGWRRVLVGPEDAEATGYADPTTIVYLDGGYRVLWVLDSRPAEALDPCERPGCRSERPRSALLTIEDPRGRVLRVCRPCFSAYCEATDPRRHADTLEGSP